MEIYLIRHTTPEIANGVCYGQSDIPLSKSFEIQKEKVLSQLPNDLDIIYSSPLKRCRMLLTSIDCSKKITDPRLMELNFGDWELKKWDEINHEELSKWMENYLEIAPPKGENFLDLHRRVSSFWDSLKNSPFKKVAVISHAGVIRIISGIVNKTDLKKMMDLKIAYGQVFKVTMKNKKADC